MTDWSAVSAVATAVSAMVVAAQTWFTRKAAEKTAAAAEATHRAAMGTEATLVEAVKARLDARAPRLRVFVEDPEHVPREPSASGGEPQPLPTSTTFRMPRDAEQLLLLRVSGWIINEGSDAAQVQLGNLTLVDEGTTEIRLRVLAANTILLRAGDLARFQLEEARPLSQWIDNWKAGNSYPMVPPPSIILGEVICSDSYDDGVLDRWRIELTGRPVAPIPKEEGGWQLQLPPGMPPLDPPTAAVRPQPRTYYRSKEADELLRPR